MKRLNLTFEKNTPITKFIWNDLTYISAKGIVIAENECVFPDRIKYIPENSELTCQKMEYCHQSTLTMYTSYMSRMCNNSKLKNITGIEKLPLTLGNVQPYFILGWPYGVEYTNTLPFDSLHKRKVIDFYIEKSKLFRNILFYQCFESNEPLIIKCNNTVIAVIDVDSVNKNIYHSSLPKITPEHILMACQKLLADPRLIHEGEENA